MRFITIFAIVLALLLCVSVSEEARAERAKDFLKEEGSTPSVQGYACEEDLIEVMFAQDSRVRLRNGALVDLATNALTPGVDGVLRKLAWFEWHRICDVPEERLDEIQSRGEANTGKPVYNLNNIYRLRIPKGLDVWAVCKELEALPGILLARPVPKPTPLPTPPNYVPSQGYLRPASSTPVGIDADYAWTQIGGNGAGVTVCDLEYSWNYNHADVTKAPGSQINSNVSDPFGDNNHGTAVIGELVSDNNSWGTTGICYGASLKTCGTYYGTRSPSWNVPGAMAVAIANLSAGDVILLEQQWAYTYGGTDYIPIEWWLNYSPNPQTFNGVYAAIVNAVSNGIHVVEAGGNGNVNTDGLTWYGNSGAIIVGAGGAYPGGTWPEGDLQRLSFSSYGSRFDLQGWGEDVVTTGYGYLYSAEGVNYYYTNIFAGTSSASPIVAGAVACCVGYWKANISGTPPSPAYLRTLLKNTGTPQITPPSGNIGPRPNLQAAFAQFPVPTITVTSPNGGEDWAVGSSHDITWTWTGLFTNVKIELSRNGGSTWETLIASTPNDGTWNWTVTGPVSTTCKVRIGDAADGVPTDMSNSNFTISQETITVTSPNGGEDWVVGTLHNITWTSQNFSGNVKIEYSTNAGSTWNTIVASTANDGTEPWTIPNTPTTQAKVKVSGAATGIPSDMSDANFTISAAPPVDTTWVRRYNGPGNGADVANAIALDGSGNVYVTGGSAGSGTGDDYATIKYYPNGDSAWVGIYNGPGNGTDVAYAIAVDGSGNVCVTGRSIGSGTGDDYATVKYDSNGTQLWVQRYNGPGNGGDRAYAIALDGSGNVYVTGTSRGSGTSDDYATVKYYPNGDTDWVRRYNGPASGDDRAYAIALDGSGNICVTGVSWTQTTTDFVTIKYNAQGDTLWRAIYQCSRNDYDKDAHIAVDANGNVYVTGWCNLGGWVYVTIKYNSSGNELWVRTYGGYGNDLPHAIAADNSGNVYVTGQDYMYGTVWDYATVKYGSNGTQLWVQIYNGPANSSDAAYAIALDGSGNVYVTGGSIGSGTVFDYATVKYGPQGNQLWVQRYNGPGNGDDGANAIALDGSGNVYVTGGSAGSGTSSDYATIKYVQFLQFLRGDANGDGVINSADIVYLINYQFIGGPPPVPLEAGDANCDGMVDSADIVYLINYQFVGGPPPGC